MIVIFIREIRTKQNRWSIVEIMILIKIEINTLAKVF